MNTFLNNCIGYGISFLRANINGNFVAELSYHLHFLCSYDKKRKHLTVLCLDNGMNIVTDISDNINETVDNAVFEISKGFIEVVAANANTNNLDRDFIFAAKLPQEYWDKFNEIKESSFLQARKLLTAKTTIGGPREMYMAADADEDLQLAYKCTIEDKYIAA